MDSHKECGTCKELLPLESFYKNKGGRLGRHSNCKRCHGNNGLRWKSENRALLNARMQEYRDNNREHVRELGRNRYDPDKARIKNQEYRRKHPDYGKEYTKQWCKDNPEKAAANSAKRRAKQHSATPEWANDFFIREMYELAQLRREATGIDWEVDHIVPLQNDLVCGLHVEQNLQVITANENRRKHNKLVPGFL